MDDPLLWNILVQVILIALNAVFACAEIAIISVNDNKLDKLIASGDKRAVRLSNLTNEPAKFLATIQVGITAVNLLGSAFAAENFSTRLTNFFVGTGIGISESVLKTLSLVLITIILLYFTVVLGELVPKRVAMRNAEKLALSMSALVSFIAKIFTPIVWFLTVSTNGLLRLLGIDPNDNSDEVTEEEIRMMVDAGTKKGAIDLDEQEMIQNVFEFDDLSAGEISTHRTDVTMLWLEESEEQWEQIIKDSRHSMYPVCDETVDNIVGVLSSKDYFRLDDKSRFNVIEKAIRPAYFVPETVRADILLKNMKTARTHFAIVLDEYGGMLGIVTMYDLLEQLVGDLEDEEVELIDEPSIEKIDTNSWKVQGAFPLDELSKQLGIELPEDDYETLGGLVFDLLGTIPDDGSTPEVIGFGLNIKVLEITDHRLERAIITLEEQVSEIDTDLTEN